MPLPTYPHCKVCLSRVSGEFLYWAKRKHGPGTTSLPAYGIYSNRFWVFTSDREWLCCDCCVKVIDLCDIDVALPKSRSEPMVQGRGLVARISHVLHAAQNNLPRCPTCEALPGDPCRTPSWKTRKPHADRGLYYLDELKP